MKQLHDLRGNGSRYFVYAMGVLFSCFSVFAPSGFAQQPASWAEIVGSISNDPNQTEAINKLLLEAQKEAGKGIIRRAYKLEDVGKNRTWLDGRSEALEDEIRETFALAMSDFAACNQLAQSLPLTAVAARITGDEAVIQFILDQLNETAGWSPLQRPGWTLYKPGNRLPEDGKDGNWLATGCGIRAIVTALEIMGDRIPSELQEKLKQLLQKEIASIADDWETKRPWFVSGNNAITNQWVLPTEGLVRACLYLGVEQNREAYELGVANLMQALSVHGPKGEFEEGVGYANFTVNSMLHAARAMAVVGDRRAMEHPFLKYFPTWLVHHIQPGRMTVNCFDAGNAQIPREHNGWRSLLSLLVFTLQSEAANWALIEQFDGPSEDLPGILCSGISATIPKTPPNLYAAYERAAMVVWRDSWKDDATGVWVRGGHELDQHDHQDRGHINFIARGKPVLIEAGTPSYSNPDMGVHYASGAGHNVLQIGTYFPKRPYPIQSQGLYEGWQKAGCVASIQVEQLNSQGGHVIVDGSACYDGVDTWRREVKWTSAGIKITDRIKLAAGKLETILFRWHLGTATEVEISIPGSSVNVNWIDASAQFAANHPLVIRQYKAPDATVTSKEDHQHTCLEVLSQNKVQELTVTAEWTSH